MHVFAIIFGFLLLVFGGGCVLLIVGGGLVTDPVSLLSDLPLLASIVLPFGVLPAALGWLLLRWGLRTDRAKRKAPDKQGPA